ncbi:PREDICTED: multiple RNA-binding domain-containing protein 1 isoform X3 [Camelina sativa]|uniref:Multiple RNA-binding domain-containing protein 1 isoform X2 n=1 Tax=Camelina sativa TaxID=90675 RepID=A0ABM0U1B3_CAMSA|nr:PREDICTED: multiple RNA-binding domain-containing protein 1 isoform X2 [Camelina sativa]XP_010434384.1 PREDICTED: multiple RNA-binding domain-containing protein 1 isoform X3 [Camelina sativa]
MSRICVKNLPKHVKEDQLRDVFSQKGEITDAKLMRSIDGKSRQFAFIGYRSAQEAQEAIKYFNKSFLDTSRIFVEIAHKVGDENAPRPWSRISRKKEEKVNEDCEKSSSELLNSGNAKGGKQRKPEVDDPEFQEFLEVHQRGKSKIWSNDVSIPPAPEQTIKEKVLVKKADEPMVSNGAEPNNVKRSSDTEKTEESNAVAPTDDVSDMDYFKSRIKKNLSDSDSDSETESSEDEDEAGDDDLVGDDDGKAGEDGHDADIRNFPIDGDFEADGVDKDDDGDAMEVEADGKGAQEFKADSDDVLDTGRLFVRNLPYTATEEELMDHFSEFGEISEVHLVLDKETKRSKGIAYILYPIPECAARAMEELDNSIFQGRLLHILPAKHRETSDKQLNDTSNLPKTFKQKREEQRKASEAGGNTKAWNSLFMRPDTILENIVRVYGVSKSELLDREAEDPAVRLALGETKVIAKTKEAFAKAGVNVTSLEEFATGNGDEKNRSKHILLVKNLPFASTEKELAQMFGKFGSLDKIVLPPTKTMALVVFLEPAEARAAIKGMAYKRYIDGPLFLEWAPANILESDNNEKKSDDVGENDVRRVSLERQVEIDPDVTESNVLHVKNLSFKTTDETLKKHLTRLVKQGKILSVKIIKHVKNGKTLSRGYGFVEFDSVETATSVYRDLQGTVLDRHALSLRFCENKRSDKVGKDSGKDKTSTKLHVKNVAFEATKNELKQLFSPFGQIKSLRLPKKNMGQYAGYAFVEFVTKQEALNAKRALASTHFYGRHLVLEWAKDDNSMEAIRKRSAAKMDQDNDNAKRRKKTKVVDESSMKFERIAE